MSENGDKLILIPIGVKYLPEAQDDSVGISRKDERARKEMLKIRDLDASIQEIELELKTERAETSDLQAKNCEELKELLLESPKSSIISKNAQLFFELFAEKETDEKSESVLNTETSSSIVEAELNPYSSRKLLKETEENFGDNLND